MRFYNFVNNAESEEANLYISGDIISQEEKDFWQAWGFDASGTSENDFKQQLDACSGKNINVYIDSYGGDVIVASAIYSMLREYKGKKVVKISSIAASAASVIAMAGDEVLMSPTAFLMIHDPLTQVYGNITEVKQTLNALESIKEGIINAYERKSNLSREKISKLMSDETWLDYNTALKYGFIDGELGAQANLLDEGFLNSLKQNQMRIYNSFKPKTVESPKNGETQKPESSVEHKQKTAEAHKQMLALLKLKAKR